MTISSNINRSGPYPGNGATVSFDRTFRADKADEIKVYKTENGATTEVTTGITKNDIGETSGTVVFDTAPATGVEITLIRETEALQQTDYSAQGSVSPEQIEKDLDNAVMISQDLEEKVKRSVKVPVTYNGDDLSFPEPSAGKAIVGKSDGTGWEEGPTSDEISSAQGHATDAEASKNAAETAETNAETAETGAVNARNKAEQWANADEDVEVEPGEYSAKHYAAKAAQAIEVGSDTTPELGGDLDANDNKIENVDGLGVGGAVPASHALGKIAAVNGLNIFGNGDGGGYVGQNIIHDGTNFLYEIPGPSAAGLLSFGSDGELRWRNAPDGNAGDVATLTTRMRIDEFGKMVLGEDANATALATLHLRADNPRILLDDTGGTAVDFDIYNNGGDLRFNVVGLREAMRIRGAAGDVLFGKTAANFGNEGTEIRHTGETLMTRDNAQPLNLNRLSSDGTLIGLHRSSTLTGLIGSKTSDIYMARNGGGGIRLYSSGFVACDTNGNNSDNAQDVGAASVRFDDVYATNGTIQTSDRNEKQDIEEISDAEQRVALACKGLLKKYRWKDSVAEKGDAARIHFGIIAQDLQDAFAAEGLDAGDYAMFISATWWEALVEIPASEESQARFETHTFHDEKDAPDGAIKRTRLGIRYPELLAFIISAI